ncbi:MBL fold metallo-hydrolase [Methanocella sp. MCL-LM]|uniref:MBL fold metallo-hydrolase n=1 Tax=Methanocella sp. MCL-LM TaxID=3412035 RepID=UPI003C74528F
MRITLLGTGDAVGTPKIGCKCPACLDAKKGGKSRRYRPGMLVSDGKLNVMIESGPDLRSQLLEHDIEGIDAVVWSHQHRDHTGGFGDFWRVKSNMPVYGEKQVLDYVLGEFHFMSFERHDCELYKPFMIGELEFTLFEVTHPPIQMATGMRIRHNGKTLVYTGDTNRHIPAESLKLMMDPDLLIADAIVPPHININKHMNAADAMDLARETRAKTTLLTHIAHLFPPHEEAVKTYPLGYDGMIIDI